MSGGTTAVPTPPALGMALHRGAVLPKPAVGVGMRAECKLKSPQPRSAPIFFVEKQKKNKVPVTVGLST